MSEETAAAWALTHAISPRDRVRVASVDASGTVLNQYAASRRTNSDQPPRPWAVHLADADGYHLIAFDLDAKDEPHTAASDAGVIAELLNELGIQHLTCRSSASDGRHVWLACTQPVEPHLVATLARLVAARCPSLDTAPLSNPATGCVRPPGSPHRDGSRSTLLGGTTDTLRSPTTTPAQLHHLVQRLAADINHAGQVDQGRPPTSGNPQASTARIDPTGHPHLPGSRRALPPASAAALAASPGTGDASVLLWQVLVGAAASHWRHRDIAALAATSPGLEHLRTRRDPHHGNRSRRSRYDSEQTLTRQWRYAVRYAAANPRSTGIDTTFDHRAGAIADTIRTLQQRADTRPGRWRHGGGPTDRRVLDTLHAFALAGVTATIEADIRRIALTCGIGRETARVALLRLASDGWIAQARVAAGSQGASWTIDPQQILHSRLQTTRSQAATRPEGAGAAERTLLLNLLQSRIALATHDIFTGAHALPHRAGNTYARFAAAGSPPNFDDVHLDDVDQLAAHGLIRRTRSGWMRKHDALRDAAAARLGVDGRLLQRHQRYRAEREIWAWWQAEHDWMCTPRANRERRSTAAQTPLWQTAGESRYPRHPRRSDGRADYAAARAAHAAGVLDPHQLAA